MNKYYIILVIFMVGGSVFFAAAINNTALLQRLGVYNSKSICLEAPARRHVIVCSSVRVINGVPMACDIYAKESEKDSEKLEEYIRCVPMIEKDSCE